MQDIGWSYDSSILVSVGLDSKVVVWSGHTFEKLKTLSQHQSHVKGITFDPANKYFATAGDDRTIRVFRFSSPLPNATAHDQINNFVLESTITAPFASSPLTTYFRRCSWSPDGAHIAAANAVNGPVSSVAIVNRGSWDSDINLIGHEGPVEVCAFSPRMFYREPITPAQMDANGNPTLPSVTVIACAGQDKTLSVWNTSYARPFVITQELAAKSISDLAWSPDGEALFMTSLDGSIMVVKFEPGELGYPAPLQENEKTLSKFGAGRRTGIVEGTEALLLEESSKAGELRGAQGRMGELMGDGHEPAEPAVNGGTDPAEGKGPASAPITNGHIAAPDQDNQTPQQPPSDPRVDRLKQRVTITKDGKKRVAPLLVSASPGAAESSLPQTQLVSGAAQSFRSDAPHTILDLSKPYDGFPKGGLPALLIGNKRKFAEVEGDDERRVEKRLTGAVRGGGAPIVLNSADGLIPPSAAVPADDAPDVSVLRPAMTNPSLSVSQVRLAVPTVRSVILRTLDGTEPQQANGADSGTGESTVVLEARNASGASRTGRPQDRDPTRISCTKQTQALWQDYLPKAVLLLTGNPNFWAAACEDGSVHVWTPAGRRLVNALIIEAQPVILDCRGWWLLCVSAVGLCHVWNIKTLSSPHPPVSLAPVLDVAVAAQGLHLTSSPGIVFARLNSRGRIVVAMSNGDGYTYSPTMYVWQRLSEPWWAVGSQYWNTTDSSVGAVHPAAAAAAGGGAGDAVAPESLSAGVIPLLERNTTAHTLLRGRAYFLTRLVKALLAAEGFEGFEAGVSVAHLENRVAAAMALGARDEFRVYLLMYAKRLGAEGLKGKIEELLRSLLGKVFDEEDDGGAVEAREVAGKGWETDGDEICGWKREGLLREVVLILGEFCSCRSPARPPCLFGLVFPRPRVPVVCCRGCGSSGHARANGRAGKHRDLQRITVPYARLLGVVQDRPGERGMAVD